jgi:hypothetical protein
MELSSRLTSPRIDPILSFSPPTCAFQLSAADEQAASPFDTVTRSSPVDLNDVGISGEFSQFEIDFLENNFSASSAATYGAQELRGCFQGRVLHLD